MRILLCKPRWFVHGSHYRYLEHVRFTPLSLGILAALSEGHEVRIADGDWEDLPIEAGWDLVGITSTTFTSQRAFELAGRARARGARTVLGGVHPSIMPEECLDHVDAVVVGEAEYVWPDVLHDAERGSLEGVYRAERPTDLADVPIPRRDLLEEPSWFTCIQATRGCPNSCRYCYLSSVPWGRYRKRPLQLIDQELAGLSQGMVFFVDDNLFVDRRYVLGLCEILEGHRKSWAVQVPTTIGGDEELLDAMAGSGCFNVQVGFQSFNPRSLRWASVEHSRVGDYKTLVERLHRRNMLVTGFHIFGFDSDGPEVFEQAVEAVKWLDLDEAHLYILTPYPGTALYEKYRREGRLLEERPRSEFGWSHAVFQPKHMTPQQLEEGVQWAYDRLYPHFMRRMPRALLGRAGLLLRHPPLVRILLEGVLRHCRVRR